MGGLVVIELGAKFPDRVMGIVAIGPTHPSEKLGSIMNVRAETVLEGDSFDLFLILFLLFSFLFSFLLILHIRPRRREEKDDTDRKSQLFQKEKEEKGEREKKKMR